MNYQTIAEIYEANTKIRQKLKSVVSGLTDEQVSFRPQETSWTIGEIVEHISIVENGIATICSRLLQKSAEENVAGDGRANFSSEFLEKAAGLPDRRTRKLQAPERVVPTGTLSLAEAFARMEQTAGLLNEIRPGLETVDTRKFKFPHPYFGDLNAAEWIAVIGGHERRHIDQIEEILSRQ
jgi:hypothetical protein